MAEQFFNEYTVTVTLDDGMSWTRDLLDLGELFRYINNGIAMHLVKSVNVERNYRLHPES